MLIASWLLACQPSVPEEPPAAPPPESAEPGQLRFEPIPPPEGEERFQLRVTKTATMGGWPVAGFGFHVLAAAGRSYGEGTYGLIHTRSGEPFTEVDRRGGTLEPGDGICNSQDFISLIEGPERLWMLSHFECSRGAIYRTALQQESDGRLRATRTEEVDARAAGDVWNPCAGDVTPWNTHLGSEEYEPDARGLQPDGLISDRFDPYGAWKMFTPALESPKNTHPYYYGWVPEVDPAPEQGPPTVQKHYAMGRFSHELSLVLDDGRTVYQSDDGSHGGWFLFVADERGKLSAGHLYAARYEMEGPAESTRASLSWVPLGHATNAEIGALIEAGVGFGDLFRTAEPLGPGRCPEGYSPYRNPNRPGTDKPSTWECLALAAPSEAVPDPAVAASRLETRRYAALQGATLEMRKGEGVSWDPESQVVYVAASAIGRSMLAEPSIPRELDHLRLQANGCGVIYGSRLRGGVKDSADQPIDSKRVLTELYPALSGRPLEGGGCDEAGIANPDNIAFLGGQGLLSIAEDSEQHAANALWTWNPSTDELTRVMTVPAPGEVSGIHWYSDLGGHGYLTVAVQRPQRGRDVPTDARRSIAGYLGPFPATPDPGAGPTAR